MESASRRETGSLKPDIDVEQKTDIYAFALNDILKFILGFAATTTFYSKLVKKPFSFAIAIGAQAVSGTKPTSRLTFSRP